MRHQFFNPNTKSQMIMAEKESVFKQSIFQEKASDLLTIAWNRGPAQTVAIDGVSYEVETDAVIPLMMNNSFTFDRPEDLVTWQFNREFYCIVDHDKEVSCVGFIFYGASDQMIIKLDEKHKRKLELLLDVFKDEYGENMDIKEEMLRMLLKRLIILITRIGKQQYIPLTIDNQEEDIIREFNLLVETNFREFHQVQDYANLLNRSPKTLSNLFAKYNDKSPLQVIKERVVLEAKRLLQFTDKTSKEISFELGFEDPATFSRFFKNAVKQSPTSFKKATTTALGGHA